jgi:hypothetical protein
LLEEPLRELEQQGRHLLNGQVKKIEGAGGNRRRSPSQDRKPTGPRDHPPGRGDRRGDDSRGQPRPWAREEDPYGQRLRVGGPARPLPRHRCPKVTNNGRSDVSQGTMAQRFQLRCAVGAAISGGVSLPLGVLDLIRGHYIEGSSRWSSSPP